MLIYPKLQVYEFQVNVSIDKNFEDYLIKNHLRFKKKPWYKKESYNYRISKHFEALDFLYTEFFNLSESIFGPLTLSEKNKTSCYAYISDKNDITFTHNHQTTSVINGVYYVKVPDAKTGTLNFYDEFNNLVVKHQPKEKTLLIFPCFLNHAPQLCNSNDYRISINMEICCNENVWTIN